MALRNQRNESRNSKRSISRLISRSTFPRSPRSSEPRSTRLSPLASRLAPHSQAILAILLVASLAPAAFARGRPEPTLEPSARQNRQPSDDEIDSKESSPDPDDEPAPQPKRTRHHEEDSAPREEQKRPGEPMLWNVVFGIGTTTGANTTYNSTTFNGSVVGLNSTQNDASGVIASLELNRKIKDFISAGVGVDWSQYKYKGSSATADTQLAVYALPKLVVPHESFSLWGAVGLGLMSMSIGTPNGSLSGIPVQLNNPTLSFALSPRIGIDFNAGDTMTIGVQGSYTTTSASVSGSAPTLGLVPVTESISRSWFAIQGRIGVRFN
jgi:hypothetical protein